MNIVTTVKVKFHHDDYNTVNKMLEIVKEFESSAGCQKLDCKICPFRGLCDYTDGDANYLVSVLNNNLE